jgi:hypothetical protein
MPGRGLQVQKPVHVTVEQWRQAIDDAGRFLDQWGSLAVQFGWTPGDLFDVPRDGACGGLGLRGRELCTAGERPQFVASGFKRLLVEQDPLPCCSSSSKARRKHGDVSTDKTYCQISSPM